jgi:tetratricopeptide (TPR) repeat protein
MLFRFVIALIASLPLAAQKPPPLERGIIYKFTTLDEYRAAIRQKPRDADLRSDYATALEKTGDLDGAIEQHRIATTLPPKEIGRAFLYRDLGLALEKKGDLNGAAEALQKAVTFWPVNGQRACGGYEDVALDRVLVAKGDYAGALAHLEFLAKKNPKDEQCALAIARVREKMK